MTGEEKLAEFVQAIDSWIEGKYVHTSTAPEEVPEALNFTRSTVMQNYGTQYTKWQEKYFSAIKENPMASEILKVKNHAEARVKILNGKADRIQSMAQILNNLSKRR